MFIYGSPLKNTISLLCLVLTFFTDNTNGKLVNADSGDGILEAPGRSHPPNLLFQDSDIKSYYKVEIERVEEQEKKAVEVVTDMKAKCITYITRYGELTKEMQIRELSILDLSNNNKDLIYFFKKLSEPFYSYKRVLETIIKMVSQMKWLGTFDHIIRCVTVFQNHKKEVFQNHKKDYPGFKECIMEENEENGEEETSSADSEENPVLPGPDGGSTSVDDDDDIRSGESGSSDSDGSDTEKVTTVNVAITTPSNSTAADATSSSQVVPATIIQNEDTPSEASPSEASTRIPESQSGGDDSSEDSSTASDSSGDGEE